MKKIRKVWIILLTIILAVGIGLFACGGGGGGDSGISSSNGNVLKVTAYTDRRGEPAAGVTVSLQRSAVTNAKGEVKFKDFPDGTYHLVFSYQGRTKMHPHVLNFPPKTREESLSVEDIL